MLKVNLSEVWRDSILLEEILSEIRRQSFQNWKPWQIYLPPELLWPMLEEVSTGMVEQWTPILFNVGVQVGDPKEVSIKFVLTDITPSPVMVKTMPYLPNRISSVSPIEVVKHGN